MLTAIVGYTYQAETLCPDCTRRRLGPGADSDQRPLEDLLTWLAPQVVGVGYDDPHGYDSDDFPKPIFITQIDCTDERHETCGDCGDLLCGDVVLATIDPDPVDLD